MSFVSPSNVKIDPKLQDKSKKNNVISQPAVSHLTLMSAIKMNVLYDGVENPVEISVPGTPSDQLRISMLNVSCKKNGSIYMIRPKSESIGRKSIISVAVRTMEGIKSVCKQEFRIKRVPNPNATLGGKSDGEFAKINF